MFFYQPSVLRIAQQLRLSPYQTHVLEKNAMAYDLSRLVKRGLVLYAPYKEPNHSLAKRLLGPRADLIGEDSLLVCDQRGIKLYSSGFFRAKDSQGRTYYADHNGMVIDRNMMYRFFV